MKGGNGSLLKPGKGRKKTDLRSARSLFLGLKGWKVLFLSPDKKAGTFSTESRQIKTLGADGVS